MKALETSYRGCRFRSRLEARWAVFFDQMGIDWEYEPQGFELTHRITGRPGTDRYLPDFWLPDFNMWAEVKGEIKDEKTLLRIVDHAGALSAPHGGCNHGDPAAGQDLVLLPPIKPRSADRLPCRLHLHKGDLMVGPWPICTACNWCDGCTQDEHPKAAIVARDIGGTWEPFVEVGWYDWMLIDVLVSGITAPLPRGWASAYKKAMQARFEHGEAG